MLKFTTLKWFSQSRLERLSMTYQFTNLNRRLTFSFDPEKARLFEPPRKCLSFEKPLTGVWLTLHNCTCRIVVNGFLRWRKPVINLLLCNIKIISIIQLKYEPEIIPRCSSLTISSVIWIFGSTPTTTNNIKINMMFSYYLLWLMVPSKIWVKTIKSDDPNSTNHS